MTYPRIAATPPSAERPGRPPRGGEHVQSLLLARTRICVVGSLETVTLTIPQGATTAAVARFLTDLRRYTHVAGHHDVEGMLALVLNAHNPAIHDGGADTSRPEAFARYASDTPTADSGDAIAVGNTPAGSETASVRIDVLTGMSTVVLAASLAAAGLDGYSHFTGHSVNGETLVMMFGADTDAGNGTPLTAGGTPR